MVEIDELCEEITKHTHGILYQKIIDELKRDIIKMRGCGFPSHISGIKDCIEVIKFMRDNKGE